MKLGTRITLAATVFAVSTLGLVLWGLHANLKRDLNAIATEDQRNVAAKVARDLAAAVRLYEVSLQQIAERLPEGDMGSPAALEQFLGRFPISQTLFTRIVIFDPAGVYVADLPTCRPRPRGAGAALPTATTCATLFANAARSCPTRWSRASSASRPSWC